MSDDAHKEIQELLRTVEPNEVHYDRPTAWLGVPVWRIRFCRRTDSTS